MKGAIFNVFSTRAAFRAIAALTGGADTARHQRVVEIGLMTDCASGGLDGALLVAAGNEQAAIADQRQQDLRGYFIRSMVLRIGTKVLV